MHSLNPRCQLTTSLPLRLPFAHIPLSFHHLPITSHCLGRSAIFFGGGNNQAIVSSAFSPPPPSHQCVCCLTPLKEGQASTKLWQLFNHSRAILAMGSKKPSLDFSIVLLPLPHPAPCTDTSYLLVSSIFFSPEANAVTVHTDYMVPFSFLIPSLPSFGVERERAGWEFLSVSIT